MLVKSPIYAAKLLVIGSAGIFLAVADILF